MEIARKVNTVTFDKTGTLTTGMPQGDLNHFFLPLSTFTMISLIQCGVSGSRRDQLAKKNSSPWRVRLNQVRHV